MIPVRRSSVVKSRGEAADAYSVPTTYRISFGNGAYLVGFAAVWFGGLAAGFVAQVLRQDWPTTARVALGLVVLGVALLPALVAALISYKVTLTEEGECEFKSLLRLTRFRAQGIRSIEWDEGDITIRHDGGKVRIVADREFELLLIRLFQLNPAIKADDGVRNTLGISPE